ncbi:hypothetical protein ACLM5J_12210 [Nocardioides sp. Bht2]|uniref:hypothetical protein n=1 Tax=Nocardioides sp. Bht2 TaxID=3392297 RepID=UPI0039B57347
MTAFGAILLAAPVPVILAGLGVTPWESGRDLARLGAWWHTVWITWFYLAPLMLVVAWWWRGRLAEPVASVLWCGVVLLHLVVIVGVAVRFAAWATPGVWAIVALHLVVGLGALASGARPAAPAPARRAPARGFR